jgi:hypothetical protein
MTVIEVTAAGFPFVNGDSRLSRLLTAELGMRWPKWGKSGAPFLLGSDSELQQAILVLGRISLPYP